MPLILPDDSLSFNPCFNGFMDKDIKWHKQKQKEV